VGQDRLSAEDYAKSILNKIDEVPKSQFRALHKIEKEKLRVAKAYNKKVWERSFQVGGLVWKTILPLGTRGSKFGKWSPSWEGPYRITGIALGNVYFVETREGRGLTKALNGKYLKSIIPAYGKELEVLIADGKIHWAGNRDQKET
jgi:hypothetical protein